MELSEKQIHLICLPTGAFFNTSVPAPWHRPPHQPLHPHPSSPNPNASPHSWSTSALNPALRITTLDPPYPARWRIDGCDSQGTQFYAIPLFAAPIVPRRIDVYIPSQDRHPAHLRAALDSASSFCIRDARAARLGITAHVVRALECWVEQEGEDVVGRLWNSSPFGSRVVIDAVVADPRRMACRLVKDFESERQMVSVARLKELWGSEVVAYPASVDIEELMLRQQLHDTISLVELPGRLGRGREKVVFKSTVHEVKYMYHELKLLLTMPSHSGIMPKPLYLVTAKDRYGGEDKVFGFILPFFEGGNLADELSRRKYNGTLNLKDQFRWARQIAETLKVINISTARFYSELKADNLLLDKDENVLFIDFEQMGNWITYSAPEIHYIEYCTRLAKSPLVPEDKRKHYKALLSSHIAVIEETSSPAYENPSEGYYTAWKSLSPTEREAAEVFSLGKTLWCIFEGCADTRNSVLKAFKFDDGQEFPEFRRAPPKIRRLIERCTRGNRDGAEGRTEVVRVGNMVFPRGRTGRRGEPLGTEDETIEAAKDMWRIRVKDMEDFLVAKTRWKEGTATEDDEKLLGFMSRPTLDEILEVLAEEHISP